MSVETPKPFQHVHVYRPWPGFEHNAWVIRRLLDAGLTPDIHFPMRSGRNVRFLIWRYYSADGYDYEISTDYGRLGEDDVARMIGYARHYLNTKTWERRQLTEEEHEAAL